jgi:hypothetical protein
MNNEVKITTNLFITIELTMRWKNLKTINTCYTMDILLVLHKAACTLNDHDNKKLNCEKNHAKYPRTGEPCAVPD